MPEMLEVLDAIRGDISSVSTMFAEDGVRPKTQTRNLPAYKMKLAKCAGFLAEVLNGQRATWQLREVMTTSDFPLLFGDILDRQVMASYVDWPSTWQGIARRRTLADFRPAKIFPPVWGADGPLDEVAQVEQYPDAQVYEQAPITWQAYKFGRRVPFSWESIINDDLDQLKDIPTRLGRAARRTENWKIANLYLGVSGPSSTLYHNNYKNIINTTNGAAVDNPKLSIYGLQQAYTVLSKMRDENSQPIMRDMVTLVVPPALEIVAKNILNATQLEITAELAGGQPDVSSSGDQRLITENWMKSKIRLQVDPYIPMIATSANGDTSWFMFTDPNTSREAISIGFLRGHEEPEIWMKSPNAVRVGGGDVSPMSGDFDTDSIMYRVRHCLAYTIVDQKATVASNGSGS